MSKKWDLGIGYVPALVYVPACLEFVSYLLWRVRGLKGDRSGIYGLALMGMIEVKAQGLQRKEWYLLMGYVGLIRMYVTKQHEYESDVHMPIGPTIICPHEHI